MVWGPGGDVGNALHGHPPRGPRNGVPDARGASAGSPGEPRLQARERSLDSAIVSLGIHAFGKSGRGEEVGRLVGHSAAEQGHEEVPVPLPDECERPGRSARTHATVNPVSRGGGAAWCRHRATASRRS